MWLLYANHDIHFVEFLRSAGFECDTAKSRGWHTLRNGDLVTAAMASGFDVLLTRDQLFAESASKAWRSFPSLSIVDRNDPADAVEAIPRERFSSIWNTAPRPSGTRARKIVVWP